MPGSVASGHVAECIGDCAGNDVGKDDLLDLVGDEPTDDFGDKAGQMVARRGEERVNSARRILRLRAPARRLRRDGGPFQVPAPLARVRGAREHRR